MKVKQVMEQENVLPEAFEGLTVEAICLVKQDDEEVGHKYTPYILTIDNGEIKKFKPLDESYNASDAINDGTDWMDTNWWSM